MRDDAEPVELDCRGMLCPAPVLALARRLPDLPVGSVVAVAATDAAARTDVPAWCRMRGQEYVGEDTAPDGTPRYLVRRVS
ncbi:MAG: sulfurtransferase TusA family protein [Nocardioidaceae bacterium]